MTITELRTAVRELMPETVSTCIELTIWDYSHRPGEGPHVSVRISVVYGPDCARLAKTICGDTAEETLELFKVKTLPKLGLSEPAPALERLAALEPEGVS